MKIAVETKFNLYQMVYVIEKPKCNNEKNYREWTMAATPCKILSIIIKRTKNNVSLSYHVQGHGKAKGENLFLDKEDAAEECQRRNSILEEKWLQENANCSE